MEAAEQARYEADSEGDRQTAVVIGANQWGETLSGCR